MKQYICLNRIDCDWAEETPPREFTLSGNGDEACPNCQKFNIREVIPPPSPWKKVLPLVLGGVVVVGLLLYFTFWAKKTGEENVINIVPVVDVTPKGNDSTNNDTKPQENENDPRPRDSSKPLPMTYRKVKGSEFCVSECVLSYSEIDNLGRIRERRIEDYAKCCTANKQE